MKRTRFSIFNNKDFFPTPKEIVMEALKDYNFPIIGNMDFGHETVDLPVPIGLKSKMNANDLVFEILESAVT